MLIPPSLESMNAGRPTVMECFRLSASSSRRACWLTVCLANSFRKWGETRKPSRNFGAGRRSQQKWENLVTMSQPAYPVWSHDGKCVYFANPYMDPRTAKFRLVLAGQALIEPYYRRIGGRIDTRRLCTFRDT
jgi:hypothetical protein